MTKQSDRDLLIEIKTTLDFNREILENLRLMFEKRFDGVSSRVSANQKEIMDMKLWKSKVIGFATAGSLIMSVLINKLFNW